jgi:hypothetical protein
MANGTNGGKDVILSYIGMDSSYLDGRLMYIAGKEDAAPGNVGTLNGPVQAQNVGIDPAHDGDVSLLSYVYTQDGNTYPRQLMIKRDSFSSNGAKFSVLVPSTDGGGWVVRTKDVIVHCANKYQVFHRIIR